MREMPDLQMLVVAGRMGTALHSAIRQPTCSVASVLHPTGDSEALAVELSVNKGWPPMACHLTPVASPGTLCA